MPPSAFLPTSRHDLFPIINPVGGAPIFLGLTGDCTDEERHLLARRVAINGFFLMLGSLIVGSHVLEFFGITLPVVRVAGGLVVTAFGWKLLQAGDDGVDSREVATASHEAARASRPVGREDSFYPLTMPLTVGPGAISVAIALGTQRPRVPNIYDLIILGGAAIAALAAMGATIYICYRFAELIVATSANAAPCVGAVIRFYPVVHWHRNHMERLQCPA